MSMPEQLGAYQRVDWHRLDEEAPRTSQEPGDQPSPGGLKVRGWIIPLSLLLCALQAVATIVATNIHGVILTPALIPVVAFVALFVLVLAVNPTIRICFRGGWMRPFNRPELVCVFAALLVTSGISTFGLSSHLVPLIPAPWNPEWNTAQQGWEESLTHPEEPLLNRKLYLNDIEAIRTYREGLDIAPPVEGSPFSEYVSYYLEAFQAIPWGAWAMPVLYWLVFIFGCYGIFYSLTYVVMPFWTHREKLIFPLAQLSNEIIAVENRSRWLPALFYRPGFWFGFALSLLVLSWNGMVAAGWVAGQFRINLGMGHNTVNQILSGTVLHGLTGGVSMRFCFLIIFTAIGIAFLLPTQISFSIWFYFFIAQTMILLAVWFGYGESARDFPSNFRSINNHITSQGAGALLVFSAICLFRAIKDYFLLARGKRPGEALRLALPVVTLFFFMAVVILWLQWNQISLFWATVVVLVITLMTTGIMRVLAESGIYWFQTHVGFYHLYQNFGLGRLMSPAMAAPLFPIYSVFFMDTKTFIAPNLMTGAKMQQDAQGGRSTYHWNVILCLIFTVLIAIGFSIYLAHLRGGQQMHSYFWTTAPVGTFDTAAGLLRDQPGLNTGNAVWYGVGGLWVMISLFLRQTAFWFPHPIGYVGLFNPLIGYLWFSFFIGWICKSVVVKYGGKATYETIKPIFIGLIMGELMAIGLWLILGVAYDFQSGLDLNRTAP